MIRLLNFFCVACIFFSEKHSTKVTGHMLDMMTPLIVEADSVSQELLDVILVCILEPYKVWYSSLMFNNVEHL